MSSKATIFLTKDNDHWYEETQAGFYHGTTTDSAFVLEFGQECKVEDYGSEGFAVVVPSDNPVAEQIRALLQEASRLQLALRRQAVAARMGMDAAKRAAAGMEERASRLYAESNPEALESERAANARLTEENERLRAALEVARRNVTANVWDRCSEALNDN